MNWVAMFPGQGSQKAGMGEELLNLYPDLLIDEFEETLGWSLKQTILQGDQSEIRRASEGHQRGGLARSQSERIA